MPDKSAQAEDEHDVPTVEEFESWTATERTAYFHENPDDYRRIQNIRRTRAERRFQNHQ